jgi:hypothetical protein
MRCAAVLLPIVAEMRGGWVRMLLLLLLLLLLLGWVCVRWCKARL